jgi:hypothetical protein
LPEGAAALSDDSAAGYAYSWRIPLTDNDATGTSALYGYTWFVREHVRPILPDSARNPKLSNPQQDSRLRRGYAQKSLVLVSFESDRAAPSFLKERERHPPLQPLSPFFRSELFLKTRTAD